MATINNDNYENIALLLRYISIQYYLLALFIFPSEKRNSFGTIQSNTIFKNIIILLVPNFTKYRNKNSIEFVFPYSNIRNSFNYATITRISAE